MPTVRLSDTARAFVQREANYLRERNPTAAENFLERLREARRNLARHPEMGRPSPIPLRALRRLVVGEYILDNDLTADRVEIVAIRHGRQQDPSIISDPAVNFETDAN